MIVLTNEHNALGSIAGSLDCVVVFSVQKCGFLDEYVFTSGECLKGEFMVKTWRNRNYYCINIWIVNCGTVTGIACAPTIPLSEKLGFLYASTGITWNDLVTAATEMAAVNSGYESTAQKGNSYQVCHSVIIVELRGSC